MKKLILVPVAVLTVLGLTALSFQPHEALRQMAPATAGSTVVLSPITTTSSSYYIPFGAVRLTCTSPTYYSLNASSATAATTSSSLAPGAITVNNVSLTRSVPLTVSAGTQYLALLLKSGVQGTCVAEQVSVDGTAGSFTTLAASGATTLSSTLNTTGPNTMGLYTSLQDAGVNNLVSTNDVAPNTLTLPSSTALAGLKFGAMTLNAASPSVATATVLSGQKCTCTPETNAADGLTKCAVSSTTLTATGPNGSSGVINYICVK